MRYLAKVTYDGTNFVGWQIQKEGRTVEEEIEKVLSRILNTETRIFGSGRTDAKVHALNQTFHFDSKEITDIGKFVYSLNSLLPEDINVNSIELVDDEFNARLSAKSKTYRYILNMGKYDVFNRYYVNQFLQKLDVTKIEEAAKLFIGEHNFQNFTSKEEDEKGFVRIINSLEVKVVYDTLIFTFNGNGFMRYMVRMIVGTLIEIGLGRIDINYVKESINSSNRKTVPYKAAPQGLYLVEVNY